MASQESITNAINPEDDHSTAIKKVEKPTKLEKLLPFAADLGEEILDPDSPLFRVLLVDRDPNEPLG